jgi:hypothetical protein
VLTARLLDRVGKGVRGAPRDALVADLTPAHFGRIEHLSGWRRLLRACPGGPGMASNISCEKNLLKSLLLSQYGPGLFNH